MSSLLRLKWQNFGTWIHRLDSLEGFVSQVNVGDAVRSDIITSVRVPVFHNPYASIVNRGSCLEEERGHLFLLVFRGSFFDSSNMGCVLYHILHLISQSA
jgi:hypothetical protein